MCFHQKIHATTSTSHLHLEKDIHRCPCPSQVEVEIHIGHLSRSLYLAGNHIQIISTEVIVQEENQGKERPF